eukprot:scaffold12393_cov105-Isochrysis_galbana.AAC.4
MGGETALPEGIGCVAQRVRARQSARVRRLVLGRVRAQLSSGAVGGGFAHVVVLPAILLEDGLRAQVEQVGGAVVRAACHCRATREEGAAVALSRHVELVGALGRPEVPHPHGAVTRAGAEDAAAGVTRWKAEAGGVPLVPVECALHCPRV